MRERITAILLAAAAIVILALPAGAAFTDTAKIDEKHKAAVEYISEKGVIIGFPDGSFRPKETLTRAQAAKILCTALEGAGKAESLTKTDTGFSDVSASHWAAKYVAYCAEKRIAAGMGDGRFSPDGQLTAAAFAKMLLVAYEKATAEDLVGAQWLTNTQNALRADALDDGVFPVENAPVTRESACRLAYNFLFAAETEAVPAGYQKATVSFTEPAGYRLLGRARQEKNGVVCDASADGVEFTVDCCGTISIAASVSKFDSSGNDMTFRAIVDGVRGEQFVIKTTGEHEGRVFLNVAPGVHTIRILKDYELSESTDILKNMTLICKPDTLKAPEEKKKFLLFIGDSDTAGFGVVQTDTPDKTTNSASAALSYCYLTAETLDADYEIIARRSMGVLKKVGTPAYNYQDMFEYQNRWRDGSLKYDFARKPDAVVLKVSGNDKSYSAEEEKAALKTLIASIRSHYGADIPIVVFYTQSTQHRPVAEALVAEDPKLYGATVTYDRSGMGNHSTAESHRGYAEELVKVLKPLMAG